MTKSNPSPKKNECLNWFWLSSPSAVTHRAGAVNWSASLKPIQKSDSADSPLIHSGSSSPPSRHLLNSPARRVTGRPRPRRGRTRGSLRHKGRLETSITSVRETCASGRRFISSLRRLPRGSQSSRRDSPGSASSFRVAVFRKAYTSRSRKREKRRRSPA